MDDWDDEEEWPDDSCNEDEVDLRPCPSCGAEIYEDAEQCPYCGEYVVWSNSAFSGKPLWWIILGLIGMVAVITALTVI
ncbi:MAG: zinc-ribbon domain-containing protein [Planctomycetaceae bacterium]|nr:zinc-ribbon domain-containing protein [Planctomycetaceae bacterium]MCA9109997.1 zinc-ribbon domain-containing protein [Planctomycetaceae bacterium]